MINRLIIVIYIISLATYSFYQYIMWLWDELVELYHFQMKALATPSIAPGVKAETIRYEVIKKKIPLFINNACSILEVFTEKPTITWKQKQAKFVENNNTLTVIGITVFLFVLLISAFLDVLKVKEEERIRRKLNPDGERRQSLAEFANKKTLRRESSKFGKQLFQIDEVFVSPDDEKKTRRPYMRGDSTNSYLSEAHKKQEEGSAPASVSETPAGEPRLAKRQSAAKLFGARPVPMVRRSSFPALPLNPDVQALMLGHRQASVDSDDEGDGKGRRVRIIRRF